MIKILSAIKPVIKCIEWINSKIKNLDTTKLEKCGIIIMGVIIFLLISLNNIMIWACNYLTNIPQFIEHQTLVRGICFGVGSLICVACVLLGGKVINVRNSKVDILNKINEIDKALKNLRSDGTEQNFIRIAKGFCEEYKNSEDITIVCEKNENNQFVVTINSEMLDNIISITYFKEDIIDDTHNISKKIATELRTLSKERKREEFTRTYKLYEEEYKSNKDISFSYDTSNREGYLVKINEEEITYFNEDVSSKIIK